MRNDGSILVYKPDHIGDVVLTTPVFQILREEFPGARIVAVVGPWAAEVLANNPHLSMCLPFTSKYMRRAQTTEEMALDNDRTLHTLGTMDFDVTINVRDDYGHVLHAYIMARGRGRLVSHIVHSEWENIVTDPVTFDGHLHEVDRHLALLAPLGVSRRGGQIGPRVFPSEVNKQIARSLLDGVDLERSICVFPGGGHHLNLWPIERFMSLARLLADRGWTPIFVGGEPERALLSPYQGELLDTRSLDITGKTSLLDLAAVFSLVGRVVSNDGGPMHLATASSAEVLALFGSTSRAFYPYGNSHMVLDHEWSCRPCPHFTYESRITCNDNMCVKSITVDEVWQAVVGKWLN